MLTNYVLITGGSNGIGAAIIQRCGADGYSCINFDIVPPQEGGSADYIKVDLSDPDAITSAIKKIGSGRKITRLVNNVGIVVQSPLEDITQQGVDSTFAVNVRAAAYTIKNLAPVMKQERFGRVVNISSRSALGRPNMAIYSASKSAINGLTRACAVEFAEHGITVNAVGPGVIGTDLLNRTFPKGTKEREALENSIPAKKIGSADDIGAAVSFFLRQENSFVTGQVMYVCGGASVSA